MENHSNMTQLGDDHSPVRLSISHLSEMGTDQVWLLKDLLLLLQQQFDLPSLGELLLQLEVDATFVESWRHTVKSLQHNTAFDGTPRKLATDWLRSQGWNITWYQTGDDQGFEIDEHCEKLCEWKITNL